MKWEINCWKTNTYELRKKISVAQSTHLFFIFPFTLHTNYFPAIPSSPLSTRACFSGSIFGVSIVNELSTTVKSK